MTTPTTPPTRSRRRTRTSLYWACTGIIAAEALAGGALDLIRFDPYLSTLTDLGYPAYLATILGVAKLGAGVVVLVPALPRLPLSRRTAASSPGAALRTNRDGAYL